MEEAATGGAGGGGGGQSELKWRAWVERYVRPVLGKYHAGYFRVSLSLCAHALLWKVVRQPPHNDDAHAFLQVFGYLPASAFSFLWSVALLTLSAMSVLYILKCIFLFTLVKEEFLDQVAVNYMFAPWISWLLLLQSSPSIGANTIYYLVLCWALMVPILALDLKIYGQWFTKGKRNLSTAANPASQLSVIGNLVGARAAAEMGWKESALCMFSLGMVHYLVVFVTLYQRLPGGRSLPSILRPIFCLFFATPSTASLAWNAIVGSFDTFAKMLFFLSLFLFMSLVCRPAMFKKSMKEFNVAWWAYSFPLTVLATAATGYSEEVKGWAARFLMLFLLFISLCVLLALMICTVIHMEVHTWVAAAASCCSLRLPRPAHASPLSLS